MSKESTKSAKVAYLKSKEDEAMSSIAFGQL